MAVMKVKRPVKKVHVEFVFSVNEGERIAHDASHILSEENSEGVGTLSPEFKKLLETLMLMTPS